MTELQTTWGWLVAIYLFLGGLGAGASIVSHLLALIGRDRYGKTVRFGAWFAAVALGVGSLVLLIDVGKPLRALVLFRSFVNPSSWMMRGAWLLLLAMLVNGASALLWTDRSLALIDKVAPFVKRRLTLWRGLLAGLAIPLNLGVAAYTGILLGVLPFRPLWHTPLLPVLFTISALDTGVALVCGYSALRDAHGGHGLRRVLEACVVTLVATEAVILFFFIRQMTAGSADAAMSIEMWLRGPLAVPFWAGVVGLGLAVPLVMAVATLLVSRQKPNWTRFAPVIGMFAALAGGWLLRFIVLSAGLRSSLASPQVFQALDNVRFIP